VSTHDNKNWRNNSSKNKQRIMFKF
jgi:hypothetical protein